MNLCLKFLTIASILSFQSVGLVFSEVMEAQTSQRGGSQAGVITGLTGQEATSKANESASSRLLKLGDTVAVGEEIRTDQGSSVELVWGRRALLTVHEQSQVTILEPRLGQTILQLKYGTVRVALSFSAGRPMDVTTVQTSSGQTITRGGILQVTVAPPLQETASFFAFLRTIVGSPANTALSSNADGISAPVETIRVFEGQARIEPSLGEANAFLLKARSEARFMAGTGYNVSELKPAEEKSLSLPLTDQHLAPPNPVLRQIVGVHIEHALEVERLLQKPVRIEDGKEIPAPDMKGTILSTSLGVPAATFPQSSGGAQISSSGSPAPATAPLPSGTPPSSSGSFTPPSTSGPPASSPPAFAAPASPPPIMAPPPVTPPPSAATLAPSQVGGLNSSSRLHTILHDLKDKDAR
ncbi:MAG: hypothetical protein ACT4OO_12180, partial [Nitrospiraceae bacterium]